VNYFSKKIALPSHGLNFVAGGSYILNFHARGYSVVFASAEFGRVFMVELSWGKSRGKGNKAQ